MDRKYNLLGIGFRRRARGSVLLKACKFCFLGDKWYVTLLSLVGMLTYGIDIVALVRGQVIINEELWRNRVRRGSQRIVSEETEKKLKLIFSVLSMEHFIFMFSSVIIGEPVLLIPWLILLTADLILETILLVLRLGFERTLPGKKELLMMAIVMFSWLQVLCYHEDQVAQKAAAVCESNCNDLLSEVFSG